MDDAPIDLRLDAAQGYVRLAGVLGVSGVSSLGRPGEANQALDRAEPILVGLLAESPSAAAHAAMGELLTSRWTLLADNAESEAMNARAAEHFLQALRLDPGYAPARFGRLMTEKNRGYDLLWSRNQPGQALKVFEQTLADLKAWTTTPPALQTSIRSLEIQLLARMGDARYALEDKIASLDSYRAAESLIRAGLAQAETVAQLDQLGDVLFHISGALVELDDQQATALAAAAEGIAVMEQVLAHGYDASAEKRLLVLLGQHADVLVQLGQPAAALASSRQSVRLRRDRFGSEPDNPTRRRDLAIGLGAHVQVLAAAGQTADACTAAREVVRLWKGITRRGQLSARDQQRNVPAADAQVSRHCRPDAAPATAVSHPVPAPTRRGQFASDV